MKIRLAPAILMLVGGAMASAATPPPVVDKAGFDAKVKPILANICSQCHNPDLMSGDVNLEPYLDPATVFTDRAAWEKITHKISAGEMPPAGIPRPPQDQLTALVNFIKGEFDKADASAKPDPGRVT